MKDVRQQVATKVYDMHQENKPMISPVNMEEQLKKVQFKDVSLSKTSNEV